MSIVGEFKKFALKGNVVDLAVGVIIGAAFGKIVSSLVDNILMPPIGMLIGNVDFSELKYVLKAAEGAQPPVVIGYGLFIQHVVNFMIVAWALFMLIRVINRMQRHEAPAPPASPAEEILLLRDIRDSLRK